MKPKIDYSLYLVTDRKLMSTPTLEDAVKQAIDGGTTLVQLREKDASSLEFYQTAVKIKRITDANHIPLIINDRVDIALAVDAAGVHVGQSDLPAHIVRSIIGKNKILGVSASSLCEAVQAQKDGADYLGVGAMFATGTKTDAKLVSMEELKKIRSAVDLPIVVIGGINRKTIPIFNHTGIDGIAVVSALISAKDISSEAG
ncbi:MAG TPA: thiamine phosphate synthase, partial [Clostridiaceae bacterium]|nr:thiamine phosphate synthase [Clostridiaceae bacterium]